MSIATAHARAVLVIDLIGDLDAVLARGTAETLATRDAGAENDIDVTLDLSRVSRVVPDGIRDLGRLVAERRLAGRSTELVVDNVRLRTKLKTAGIVCTPVSERVVAADRRVMIARHAPAA